MSRAVLLDSGPLGMITHPRTNSEIQFWLRYTPSDCFETFPFPPAWESSPILESTGRDILTRQGAKRYGTKVVDPLARDLRREFPDMKGFSSRNLRFMRSFAEAWPDEAIVQQLVAQLPWGHNVRVLESVKNAVSPLECSFPALLQQAVAKSCSNLLQNLASQDNQGWASFLSCTRQPGRMLAGSRPEAQP